MRRGPPLIKNSTEGRPYWDFKGGKNAPSGGEKRLKKKKERVEHPTGAQNSGAMQGANCVGIAGRVWFILPLQSIFLFFAFFFPTRLISCDGIVGRVLCDGLEGGSDGIVRLVLWLVSWEILFAF